MPRQNVFIRENGRSVYPSFLRFAFAGSISTTGKTVRSSYENLYTNPTENMKKKSYANSSTYVNEAQQNA